MKKIIRSVFVLAIAIGLVIFSNGNHVWASGTLLGTVPGCPAGTEAVYDEAGNLVNCYALAFVPEETAAGHTITGTGLSIEDLQNRADDTDQPGLANPPGTPGEQLFLSGAMELTASPPLSAFYPPIQVCFPAPATGWASQVRWWMPENWMSVNVFLCRFSQGVPLTTFSGTSGVVPYCCAYA